jgi:hypothetical protein
MHKPSPEQQLVLDHVRQGKNVIVEACAGSGKSTTILSLAQSLPHLRILQFTYNKMLRLEIKDKVTTLKLSNLEVHTFHSFAVKHYTDEAAVDTGIRHLLTSDMPVRHPIPAYDVVVLDECQDMTQLFFQLVHSKALKNMMDTAPPDHKVQLVVLGDAMQTLYEFKGADSRFLTLADTLWQTCPHLRSPRFERCTLRTSYRLTRPMAAFVNQAMLGEERMLACRDGPQVSYLRRPRHQIEEIILYRIDHFLKKGDTPADFFILAYSVKSGNHNIVRLANKLVEANIPIHIPAFETDEMDDCVVDGKVVFSSFHTAKGRERKHVFLIGFDTSYFSFSGGTEDKSTCPNTLYVGCTRATQNLFLCEYDSACPLDFMHMNHHQLKQSGFVNFQGLPQTRFYPQDEFCQGGPLTAPEIVTRDVTPTKLTKFLSDSVLDELTPLLDRIFVPECVPTEEALVDLPRIVRTRMGLYEDISDLNGIAIPAYYYDHLLNPPSSSSSSSSSSSCPGDQSLRNIISNKRVRWQQKNEHEFLMQQQLPSPRCQTIGDYLYLANVCVCSQEELYFKLKQIDEYTWLTEEMMQQCMKTLDLHLGPAFAAASSSSSPPPLVEHVLIDKTNEMETARQKIDEALFPFFGHEMRFKFVARADVVTPDTLWELKCVQKLSQEHLLQTAVYAWIHRVTAADPTIQHQTKILNVRTSEVLRLEATLEELTLIMHLLLRNKFAKPVKLGDDAFVLSSSSE